MNYEFKINVDLEWSEINLGRDIMKFVYQTPENSDTGVNYFEYHEMASILYDDKRKFSAEAAYDDEDKGYFLYNKNFKKLEEAKRWCEQEVDKHLIKKFNIKKEEDLNLEENIRKRTIRL